MRREFLMKTKMRKNRKMTPPSLMLLFATLLVSQTACSSKIVKWTEDVQLSNGQVITVEREWMPDASCLQELERESHFCISSTTTTKQCLREQLSPNCLKQYDAGESETADAACKDQLQRVVTLCVQTTHSSAKQCLNKRLNQKCKEQVNVAQQRMQEEFAVCQGAAQKVQRLCGDWFKNNQCYQDQAKLGSGCPK